MTQARRVSASRSEHGPFLQRIEAFHVLEHGRPSKPSAWPGNLRIAAFNTHRLTKPGEVRALMDRNGVNAALLSEADIGMARSGNVHTIRELAGLSGDGYLYGVEFVELDLGAATEIERHAGGRNACGLHGNAIVTRLELEEPCLIALEESGFWFPGRDGAQRRIGGRMALAARIAVAPRPLWLVSTHLESQTDPADRCGQIQALLRALDDLAPREACIIGGDFNTKALPRGEDERDLLIEEPERYEPLFADLRRAGFEWAAANLACPTQRAGPSRKPEPPFGKLDWIVTRGVAARNAVIAPALDGHGEPMSDHDMIAVDIAL